MYFVIGWPQTLSSSENIHLIVPNSDQSIFLFLSQDAISLWYCRPVVKIVQYQRTSKSLQQFGENVSAVWKSDSSQIVVQTSQDFLLFYQVVISEDKDTILQLIEHNSRRHSFSHDSSSDETNKIPALILELQHTLHVTDGITCFMSAEEEIVISTKTGNLCGVEWEGQFDDNFKLNITIPSNYHQKKEEQSCYIRDFKYSTIIGGFSLVFYNGLGAFLPLNENTTSNFTQIQLISHVDSAVCTAINHKYALIAFGLNSSDGVLCGFDEIDRRFIVSHRLSLPSNSYPEVDKFLGSITALQWTPDSAVLATAWQNGGFALWTVFGSLLTCSLSWNYSLDIDNKMHAGPYRVSSLAFGKEGFHLWMATKNSNLLSDNVEEEGDDTKCEDNQLHFNWVCKLSLAKSVLTSNPCSSVSVETVLLASEDRMFVGGNKSSSLFAQLRPEEDDTNIAHKKMQMANGTNSGTSEVASSNATKGFLFEQEQSNAVDSFQWITVPLPQSYLDSNWPIRYFAIDPHTSQNLAITGLNGLAIYSLLSRRWKLFGNENHERDFVVTGGFLWFYDYLICGCYNLVQDCYEIRAYSHRKKLDNANAKILTIDKEIYLLSLHQNRLLALCSNGSILLFDLHLFKRDLPNASTEPVTELNISSPIRVIVNNLDIFPDCVTVCLLTDLHVDMYHSAFQSESSQRSHLIQTSAVARSHSILLSMCGRVQLLEMDIDTTGLPLSSDDDEDHFDSSRHNSNSVDFTLPRKVNGDYEPSVIKYRKAVKLASNVENLWILPHDEVQLSAFRPHAAPLPFANRSQQLRPHLVTSLYLSCGAQGMAVWLSLEHSIRPQYLKGAKKDLPMPSSDNEHAYISKRIMLPLSEIASNIYPLAIRFREAIVLGAESDFTHPNSFCFTSGNSKNDSLFIPFCLVKRTSQVYLHYILRELLRRNLGYRAWEIANTCTALPHFVHSLELLLHGVLEEEASSSQPIPDALLPRVVDFIRAFPVFLQTVINCARKTEYARWPHLFSVVGSPKDLFQQCLLEGQLETASSYIIVLHNLEKPEVATKCASRLLQAARIAGSWVTVKELKRFLRTTNCAEGNDLTPPLSNLRIDHNSSSNSNNNNEATTANNDAARYETSQSNCTSHNVSPLLNGQNGCPSSSSLASPNNSNKQTSLFTCANSVEQQPSAKGSSPPPTSSGHNSNHISNYTHMSSSRTIPGAAIKQMSIGDETTVESNDSSLREEEANIVMNDGDDSGNSMKDEENSLSNSEEPNEDQPTEERIKVNNLSYAHLQQRNGRAYPGSIRRTNHEVHPNAPFQFLANPNHFATVASSTSSISSAFSSAESSSALSSASVSPTVHKNRLPSNFEKPSSTLAAVAMANDGPKMLKAVPISTDESNQCVIS